MKKKQKSTAREIFDLLFPSMAGVPIGIIILALLSIGINLMFLLIGI